MTYSKYACDVCGTTAEPETDRRGDLPPGWEPFTLLVLLKPPLGVGFSGYHRDLCPACVQRPLVNLLAALREKQGTEGR